MRKHLMVFKLASSMNLLNVTRVAGAIVAEVGVAVVDAAGVGNVAGGAEVATDDAGGLLGVGVVASSHFFAFFAIGERVRA